jgi:D-alanyl-D-alanine carboxypeptidase
MAMPETDLPAPRCQWYSSRAAFVRSGGFLKALLLVLCLAFSSPARAFELDTNSVVVVNDALEKILADSPVPAIACAVVRSNRLEAVGAAGLRKAGITNAPVTLEDKWHHGSLTKSMTATLAAMMIREGRLHWTTTLADVFPDLAPGMDSSWRGVTLELLLANRAGAPTDLRSNGLWDRLWNFEGTAFDARRLLLEELTSRPTRTPPGTAYEYSNAGFSIAGHMLETIAGKPWEDLLAERLFKPLGMTSAGFGVPATPRYIDQPWGHRIIDGKASPVAPGISADNPPAIGPGGVVHCSIVDLAKYTALHMQGHLRDQELLPRETFVKLHTALPDNSNYAFGWSEVDRAWAKPGKAYTHNGSNLQWFSVIWFAPARQFAVVVSCNAASRANPDPGAQAVDKVAGEMIRRFLRD